MQALPPIGAITLEEIRTELDKVDEFKREIDERVHESFAREPVARKDERSDDTEDAGHDHRHERDDPGQDEGMTDVCRSESRFDDVLSWKPTIIALPQTRDARYL